ncbi:MAG: DUF6677 family protein [Vicinamibacterales bacterium]
MRATTAERAQTLPPVGAAALAWVVPGAAHLVLGKRQKGVIFLLAIPCMFAIGLALDGRIFPFDLTQPLAALAAVAARGVGALGLAAGWLGFGKGVVTAASYEYGNTFIIVAGLLNMLVALDAFDVASGRK